MNPSRSDRFLLQGIDVGSFDEGQTDEVRPSSTIVNPSPERRLHGSFKRDVEEENLPHHQGTGVGYKRGFRFHDGVLDQWFPNQRLHQEVICRDSHWDYQTPPRICPAGTQQIMFQSPSGTPSKANESLSTVPAGGSEGFTSSPTCRPLSMLEDMQSVGRHRKTHQGERHYVERPPPIDRLHGGENINEGPLPRIRLCRSPEQILDGLGIELHKRFDEQGESNLSQVRYQKNIGLSQENGSEIFGALLEKGIPQPPPRSQHKKEDPFENDLTHGKTRKEKHNPIQNHSEVSGLPDRIGQVVRHRESNNSSLTKDDEEVWSEYWQSLPKQFRNSHAQHKPTHIARRKSEFALPLNVKPVSPIRLAVIRDFLSDEKRERLDLLLQYLGEEPSKKHGSQHRNSTSGLSFDDVNKLASCHIIEETRKVPELYFPVIPFTVIEEKANKLRRRFIAWPKESNYYINSLGYTPDVPLQHISAYLPAVRAPIAFVTDLTTSFFQIELPEKISDHFVFKAFGKYWKLTRLPMGHIVSPEIMQIVTSALAGVPTYVRAIVLPTNLRTDIWIDNIRFSGSTEDVTLASKLFYSRAKLARATYNKDETSIGYEYDFIGAHFNHSNHSVSVRESTLNKINDYSNQCSFGELERLYSQILFSSSILGINLGEYYWVLKMFRRRASHLANCAYLENTPAHVSPSVEPALKAWIARIRLNTPRIIEDREKYIDKYTLFTDASLKGWGGVLIHEPTMSLWSYGSAWRPSFDVLFHINELEALAVLQALTCLEDLIPYYCSLDIRIDNTSVEHSLKKGHSKSFILNQCSLYLANWLKQHHCIGSITRVISAENLADTPSRGIYSTDKLPPNLFNVLVDKIDDTAK